MEHKLSISLMSFMYSLLEMVQAKKLPTLYIVMTEQAIHYMENFINHEAGLYKNVEEYRERINKLTMKADSLATKLAETSDTLTKENAAYRFLENAYTNEININQELHKNYNELKALYDSLVFQVKDNPNQK